MARRAVPCGAVPPAFETIARYWDPTHARHAAKILPGEFYVTTSDELIVTVLGSCVAACVRDPLGGVGGMNHFMLPTSATGIRAGESPHAWLATRFGNFAMESLLNTVLTLGGRRDRLEVKLFGGGRVLEGLSDVGRTNIEFAREYVRVEQLRTLAEDLGGIHPRKVYFDPRTGRANVRYLKVLTNDTITVREAALRARLDAAPTAGSVDLF